VVTDITSGEQAGERDICSGAGDEAATAQRSPVGVLLGAGFKKPVLLFLYF